VPDTAIGKVAHSIVDKLKPGTMVIVLDAAAPYAGHLSRPQGHHLLRHPSLPSTHLQR